jgi:hypothetical protein
VGIIGLGTVITFFIFYFLADHFPGLFKLIIMMFFVSLTCLMIDPQMGAVVTLCCLAVLFCIAMLVAIPLILSYLAGVAFIVLFIIGLGQLVK